MWIIVRINRFVATFRSFLLRGHFPKNRIRAPFAGLGSGVNNSKTVRRRKKFTRERHTRTASIYPVGGYYPSIGRHQSDHPKTYPLNCSSRTRSLPSFPSVASDSHLGKICRRNPQTDSVPLSSTAPRNANIVKVDFQLKLKTENNKVLCANLTQLDRVLDYAYCSCYTTDGRCGCASWDSSMMSLLKTRTGDRVGRRTLFLEWWQIQESNRLWFHVTLTNVVAQNCQFAGHFRYWWKTFISKRRVTRYA